MRRRVLIAGIAVAAILVLVFAGFATWYVPARVESGAFTLSDGHLTYGIDVVAVDAGSVTLRGPASEVAAPGTLGLQWEGGYGQLGAVRATGSGTATRSFMLTEGAAPVAGTHARVDSFAFPGDPKSGRGIDFQEVTVKTPLQSQPAWYVPGTGSTWVIFVHGKGSRRAESLRILPTVVGLGYPALAITYRDDPASGIHAGDHYAYGTTEWVDLEAAVRWAEQHGAHRVVLYGYSMGGAIVVSFLLRSPLAADVSAAILDAPALDLGASAGQGMRDAGVPAPLVGPLRAIAGWRLGVHWRALDYLQPDRVAKLRVPILLFQGGADHTVPASVGRRFAHERPDLVEYHETPAAGHVRSWNVDPAAYESAVRAFLTKLGGSGG